MFERGAAIIYVTGKAEKTALKIKEALEKAKINCKIFAPEKIASNGVFALKPNFRRGFEEIFSRYDAIVAVMAAGIIIRAVAPLLKSKLTDPAVVCVDVAGRFAISLISGHYGGANYLAKLIAEGIGAVAVITTASEAVGKKSVEEIAEKLHCRILNPEVLKEVNSLIINDGKIALIYVGKLKAFPLKICGYKLLTAENLGEALNVLDNFDGGIFIIKSADENEALKAVGRLSKPIVLVSPKRIAVGIGARKNVDGKDVYEAVVRALRAVGVPLFSVDVMATVDVKRDSFGIVSAADGLGLPIRFISVEELRSFSHPDLSPDSELVEEKIGVGGVCERAALIAIGGKGRLILKKMKMNGVTVAVAEAE
jgi:cobalt-precorrin 5A hydrolase